MNKHEYHELICTSCNIKVFIETMYNEEYAQYIDVKCPKCNKYIGEAKVDDGYVIHGTQKFD